MRRVHSVDVTVDKVYMTGLREAAVKAKVELSRSPEAIICDIYGTKLGLVKEKITVPRSKFEDVVEHLIERIKVCCQNCLKDAGGKEVDEVILVGGMTRVPRVKQIVQEVFRKSPSATAVDPEEAVALGVAIQAGLILEDQKSLLAGVVPLSLGIDGWGGRFERIIERNSEIPIKRSRLISIEDDNISSAQIHVLQGERCMASDNSSLGKFLLTGIPLGTQGERQILLTFHVKMNSTLVVSAHCMGKEWSSEFSTIGPAANEHVKRVVKEAIRHRVGDEMKNNLIDLRRMAAFRISSVETLLEEKVISVELRRQALSALAALKSALETEEYILILWRIKPLTMLLPELDFPGEVPSDSDDDMVFVS